MGDVISGIFTFLAVVAIAFIVFVLIASFVRFQLLAHRIRRADPGEVHPEDVFQLRIVQELGALHQSPVPFSVLLLEPVIPPDFEGKHGAEAVDQWMTSFMEKLRGLLRMDDEVLPLEGRLCGVLGRFGCDRAETVAKRVSAELARGSVSIGAGTVVRWPVNIGVVSHPEHGDRAADLMDRAREALGEARKSGVGRAHILPAPAPVETDTRKAPKPQPKREQSTSTLLDELTGVLRADRLGTAMQKFMARHRKDNRPVSVIYLSLDYFHQYRDHYNEDAANSLLKGVADLLSARTRETDVLARADESEFAVVMDCAPVDALGAAQRLASDLKKVPFRVGSTNLRVTISAGIAGYPDHTGQAREMLHFAQAAMTAARTRGRSVCLLYQPEMQPRQQDRPPVDVF